MSIGEGGGETARSAKEGRTGSEQLTVDTAHNTLISLDLALLRRLDEQSNIIPAAFSQRKRDELVYGFREVGESKSAGGSVSHGASRGAEAAAEHAAAAGSRRRAGRLQRCEDEEV